MCIRDSINSMGGVSTAYISDFNNNFNFNNPAANKNLEPVSYTHLDVYKRQVFTILLSTTNWSAQKKFTHNDICLLYTSRCV